MNTKITSDLTLREIEKIIKKEIPQCEYWGDLDLSYEEYEILLQAIRGLFHNNSLPLDNLCGIYSHAVVTFLVFFVRYEYDANFWDKLSDRLDIDININDHKIFGDWATFCFRKYKMDYSDAENDAYKIIAPIMHQACLPPESNLDDLFYVLKYGYSNYFDPEIVIDDLLSSRSYMLRKPMRRFLNRFRNGRAIDFLLEVRDAMLSVDQKCPSGTRYEEAYFEWKTQESSAESVNLRKKQDNQTRPYLYFDNGNKGLSIVLPRIILEDEWVEDVIWTIKTHSGYHREISCNVIGAGGKRYTDNMTVPVPPSDEYLIEYETFEGFDDGITLKWNVEGIQRNKVVTFNSSGRQFSANYLQKPFMTMILSKDVDILTSDDLLIEDQYYPTNDNSYRVVSIIPLSQESKLIIDSDDTDKTYILKPQINMALEGETLFSLDASSNIFTQIPTLVLSADDSVIFNNLEICIRGHFYPIDLSDVQKYINISKFAKDIISVYGTYSIRLYQNKKYLKQIEFYYVPNIKTNYVPMLFWPSQDTRKEDKKYVFQKIDGWELEFNQCKVFDSDESYSVMVPSNLGCIDVILRSLADDIRFECHMKLPVKVLSVEIVDEYGELLENITNKIYKTGVDLILESEKWLSIKIYGYLIDRSYSVCLVSPNGIEKSVNLKVAQNGSVNINLGVFYDALRRCPLPCEIDLVCDEDESKSLPLVRINEKLAMEERVSFLRSDKKKLIILKKLDDGKDIEVTRFGYNQKSINIPYSEAILSKSGTGIGYKYPYDFSDGIYIISGSKEQSFFEFEDDEIVELCPGNNILVVSDRDKSDVSSVDSLGVWLETLIFDLFCRDSQQSIQKYQSYIVFLKNPTLKNLADNGFNDFDIEKLVALAYIQNSKLTNDKKDFALECMRLISREYMHVGDRYRIIKLLVEMEVPSDIFDICLCEYDLQLFDAIDDEYKSLAASVVNYSVELSMMLMMSSNDSIKECIGKEKYRELIGKEAIRKLLGVSGINDPEMVAVAQKNFINEVKPSYVTISFNDEISGNETAIQGMIVWDNKNPFLDISKKPDYGIYFAHIKYVDQYVNWFKSVHDRNMNLKPEIKNLMIKMVMNNIEPIENGITVLEKDDELKSMAKTYFSVIRKRFITNSSSISLNTVSLPRFFYLQGIAAFFSRLPLYREDLDDLRKIGISFMADADIVAPRLSKRDLLMAEVYRYLKFKEEFLKEREPKKSPESMTDNYSDNDKYERSRRVIAGYNRNNSLKKYSEIVEDLARNNNVIMNINYVCGVPICDCGNKLQSKLVELKFHINSREIYIKYPCECCDKCNIKYISRSQFVRDICDIR